MDPFLPQEVKDEVADHIIQYAKKHGMWPTIDFIVERWIEKNPDEYISLASALQDERAGLQNRFGTNEQSRNGKMPMKRTLEIPAKVGNIINILFTVEKTEYPGGEKEFWREFGRRYPVFKVGD